MSGTYSGGGDWLRVQSPRLAVPKKPRPAPQSRPKQIEPKPVRHWAEPFGEVVPAERIHRAKSGSPRYVCASHTYRCAQLEHSGVSFECWQYDTGLGEKRAQPIRCGECVLRKGRLTSA